MQPIMQGTCNRLEPIVGPRKTDSFTQWIIDHESGGNVNAKNPHSSAFGIGQLIRATREAIASQLGFNPDTTNYDQQLQMMQKYIEQRYGTAEAAYYHWLQHRSY